jgi:hypothetical protein
MDVQSTRRFLRPSCGRTLFRQVSLVLSLACCPQESQVLGLLVRQVALSGWVHSQEVELFFGQKTRLDCE